MKKAIMFLIVFLLLIIFVVAQTIELANSKDLPDLKIDSNSSEKIINYYSDKIKGITKVSGYKTDNKHVIISFEGNNTRVILSKKEFEKRIK